jgi:hypothetical protein
MERQRCHAVLVALCVLSIFFLLANNSEAAVSVSVSPMEGGSSLRFGRVDVTSSNTKEVRLRITSGDGRQYQVFQRIIEPLINEQGGSLDLEAVQSYTLIGSNSQGTLYQQDLEGLSLADQLLYTSNDPGDSDAFTLIYQINSERINAGGDFTGKIVYTVRPIAGGAPVDASTPGAKSAAIPSAWKAASNRSKRDTSRFLLKATRAGLSRFTRRSPISPGMNRHRKCPASSFRS